MENPSKIYVYERKKKPTKEPISVCMQPIAIRNIKMH